MPQKAVMRGVRIAPFCPTARGMDAWAPSSSAESLPAALCADADAIVEKMVPQLESGDVVAILSNGGFGGIYEKLPAALGARKLVV